jgi:hypothetical protein
MTKTPQELAEYLRRINAWRRSGTHEPMPNPTEIGEVIDQVIAILEDLPKRVLSECCEAQAVLAGKPDYSQWNVCPQCCQPCDVFYQDNETTQLQ